MILDHQMDFQREMAHARAALESGATSVAGDHIDRALRIDPASSEARLLEAQYRLRQNQPAEALTALDAHDLHQPADQRSPQAMFLRAESLLAAGNCRAAKTLLRRLGHEYPDDVRPHRLLAGLCLITDDAPGAIAALTQVVKLEPSDSENRRLLVNLVAPEHPQQALDMAVAGENFTGNGETGGHGGYAGGLLIARLLRRVGRMAEAEEGYAALLDAGVNDPAVWAEAGQLAVERGDDARAVGRIKQAVRTAAVATSIDKPPLAAALHALAHTHMVAGRSACAGWVWFRAWRSAGKTTPVAVEALAGLIVCALDADRNDLARQLVGVLEQHADADHRRALLADHWLVMSAGRALRAALHRNAPAESADGSPLNALLQDAAARFQKHLQEHPRRADSHYHLAVCMNALGHPGASAQVDQAVEINPGYVAARNLREKLRAG